MDFKTELVSLLSKATKINQEELSKLISVPPDSKLGDYAFPCFKLAQELHKNPMELANELAKKLKSNKLFEKVEVKGAYLNFFINKKKVAKEVLTKISRQKQKFGKGKKKKEKVMIEFCQVNTHKAFHVGHFRGTLLGNSLVNLYRFSGYKTLGVNYQGDIGAHVAKVIWYLTTHKVDYPSEHKGRWLGQIYQKANQAIGDDEERKKEVSLVLQKLENGDVKLTKLWKKTRKWSLDDYAEFYQVLGLKFDKFFFESQFEKKGKEMVLNAVEKKIAYKDKGAIVIDLGKFNLGIFLLLKSDGTALYSTKDLALAKEKFEKYNIDKSINVVGSEQKLYFQQIFKTLEIMGFKQAKDCHHVPFGLVNLEGGKISSREGELIYAEELVEEVIQTAEKAIKERHADVSPKEINQRAHKIALAAIKFSFLNQDNNKEIIFSKERSLSFEGETGPYLQYSVARINSVLRKAELVSDLKIDYTVFDEKEYEIIKKLSEFPSAVEEAMHNFRPVIMTRYLLDLAQMFNEFYHASPILTADEETKKARLQLIVAVKHVLENGLYLLGIETLEEM